MEKKEQQHRRRGPSRIKLQVMSKITLQNVASQIRNKDAQINVAIALKLREWYIELKRQIKPQRLVDQEVVGTPRGSQGGAGVEVTVSEIESDVTN